MTAVSPEPTWSTKEVGVRAAFELCGVCVCAMGGVLGAGCSVDSSRAEHRQPPVH
jgi:hypothetical protein